jgi:hypothetical protein
MIKNKSRFFLFFAVSLTVLLAGCGYTSRSMIADKYKAIYIKPFVNKIDISQESSAADKYRINRPTLETDITKFLINKFLTDGNLKPSAEETADLVLKGELIEFRRDPLKYDSGDEVSEYRLNLVVNISLWDRINDKLVWEERGFTGDTTYFTSGNRAKTEDTAIVEALNDLVRRITERTVEQW